MAQVHLHLDRGQETRRLDDDRVDRPGEILDEEQGLAVDLGGGGRAGLPQLKGDLRPLDAQVPDDEPGGLLLLISARRSRVRPRGQPRRRGVHVAVAPGVTV